MMADRKKIVEMTSAELYALDFEKMSSAERAGFRQELEEKVGHGPLATPREHRIYAEAHARWSDWIKDHPEDAKPADAPETGDAAPPAPSRPLFTPPPSSDPPVPSSESDEPSSGQADSTSPPTAPSGRQPRAPRGT